MKTLVMTRRELLREAGLSPAALKRLEKALGIPTPKAPRVYTLAQCLKVLKAAAPKHRPKG
jgi:hypothetical protein